MIDFSKIEFRWQHRPDLNHQVQVDGRLQLNQTVMLSEFAFGKNDLQLVLNETARQIQQQIWGHVYGDLMKPLNETRDRYQAITTKTWIPDTIILRPVDELYRLLRRP